MEGEVRLWASEGDWKRCLTSVRGGFIARDTGPG